MLLNPSEGSVFDTYFRYMTHLGDGVTALVLSAILLIVNRKWALALFLSFIISGGITQIIKNIFSDIMRPSAAIGIDKVHHVVGTNLSSFHSFPSGHTTSAFAIFLSIALLLKNKKLGLICFLFAVLIGYSRIYLSQHFPIDVFIGSVIGVVTTISVFGILNKQ